MSITKEEAIKYLEKLGFTLIDNEKNKYHFRYMNMHGDKDMLNAAYYKAQACLELAGIKYNMLRTDGPIGYVEILF